MNPNEVNSIMQRVADRMIQHGYATAALMDDSTNNMRLTLTPKGNALRSTFKELLVTGHTAHRDEILALCTMLLIAED